MTFCSILSALAFLCSVADASARELRVCADPNNLPFSNQAGEGFENKIVERIAEDLGATLTYTWWAQRRGFVRNTLKAGLCDLWPGVVAGMDILDTTHPYYRSSYVFVTRTDRALDITSFDDPRLRELIGVQMVGNDANNMPPAHALARHGITANVRGYMLYGDYSQPNPPAMIIEAVVRGYRYRGCLGAACWIFAIEQTNVPLTLTKVSTQAGDAQAQMVFAISMGVRKGDAVFRHEIDGELEREQQEITQILARYHVPIGGGH